MTNFFHIYNVIDQFFLSLDKLIRVCNKIESTVFFHTLPSLHNNYNRQSLLMFLTLRVSLVTHQSYRYTAFLIINEKKFSVHFFSSLANKINSYEYFNKFEISSTNHLISSNSRIMCFKKLSKNFIP